MLPRSFGLRLALSQILFATSLDLISVAKLPRPKKSLRENLSNPFCVIG